MEEIKNAYNKIIEDGVSVADVYIYGSLLDGADYYGYSYDDVDKLFKKVKSNYERMAGEIDLSTCINNVICGEDDYEWDSDLTMWR